MNVLLILLVLLILYLYFYSLQSVSTRFEILQTDLAHIDANILREKLPIAIENMIVDPNDLVRSLFRYQFITRYDDKSLSYPFQIVVNKSRYLILYNQGSRPLHVRLYHGKNAQVFESQLIQSSRHHNVYTTKDDALHDHFYQIVRLHPSMLIIVPHRWAYSLDESSDEVDSGALVRIHLHDATSYLLG